MSSKIQAIIFDFNGIICDDEPIHFEVLQRVLAEEGIIITQEEYYSSFLGRDDRECFRSAFEQARGPGFPLDLASLIQRKTAYYLERVTQSPPVFPGVVQLIAEVSTQFALAVASGALLSEVKFVLTRLGVLDRFQAIVACEDVCFGKPAPDIFLEALRRLNQQWGSCTSIPPENCLVVEDSLPGVRAALAAGMRCLAVTNSHSNEQLRDAHQILPHLKISAAQLLGLFDG